MARLPDDVTLELKRYDDQVALAVVSVVRALLLLGVPSSMYLVLGPKVLGPLDGGLLVPLVLLSPFILGFTYLALLTLGWGLTVALVAWRARDLIREMAKTLDA